MNTSVLLTVVEWSIDQTSDTTTRAKSASQTGTDGWSAAHAPPRTRKTHDATITHNPTSVETVLKGEGRPIGNVTPEPNGKSAA